MNFSYTKSSCGHKIKTEITAAGKHHHSIQSTVGLLNVNGYALVVREKFAYH